MKDKKAPSGAFFLMKWYEINNLVIIEVVDYERMQGRFERTIGCRDDFLKGIHNGG